MDGELDLGYVRAYPHQLPLLLEHQRIRMTPVAGGSICDAQRLTLDDGTDLFAKSLAGPTPPGFFAAEAAGLRWLGAGGAPVPEVIAATDDLIVLSWLAPGPASPAAAEQLGRDLAALHRAGADRFGAPWPGYIGSLPLDNTPTGAGWAEWFAQRRLLPYLRASADNGALAAADVALVDRVVARIDRLAGPAEPAARLHGDLWPGNVHWGTDRAWLVDPAAHGGHRESDLAQLALFGGLPGLDRLRAAYQEVWPLPEGWRDRLPLHQLHLLLVHTALFGAGYRASVVAAAHALG